jgi:hypothetical protein
VNFNKRRVLNRRLIATLFQNQARFSIEEAQEVLQWVSETTGIPLAREAHQFETDDQVSDALKDGVILCRFYALI